MGKGLTILFSIILMAAIIISGNVFAKETYKIGVAAPLSGGLGFLGEGIMNAMVIAKEGLGETKYDYELIFEDNQHDPKMSVTLAKKFISADKVDAIVSIGDESGPVISPIATSNNVLHFAIAVQRYISNGHVNFMHWTPALEQTSLLIEEMNKRGIRKVGVFRSRYIGFVELFEAFKKQIKGTDIKIVTEQVHDPKATDFRMQIMMAKKTNPDIYLILTLPPALELLAKQLKESGVSTPLTSCEAFDISPEMELFEGNWYIAPAVATGCFREAYVAKHGSEPPLAAGNAYDIFNLIVRAAEGAQSSSKPTASQVADELHNVRYHQGALGTLYVDSDGVVVSSPQVKIIRDAKPEPLYK